MLTTYNLFRRKDTGHLYCAVPEHRAVPTFLSAAGWEFGGKLDEVTALLGFNRSAAPLGVRLNGFHLFHAFPASGPLPAGAAALA